MVIIRDATEADMPAILDIYNDVILNTTAVYCFDTYTLEQRMPWYHERIKSGYPIVVAVDNSNECESSSGRIVGYATYGPFRPFPGFKHTVEHTIHVASPHRGKGIGKILLEWVIQTASAQKYHCVVGGIDSANVASISLHKKYGFEQVAYMKEVGFKFDRWLDLVLMQLTFKEPPPS